MILPRQLWWICCISERDEFVIGLPRQHLRWPGAENLILGVNTEFASPSGEKQDQSKHSVNIFITLQFETCQSIGAWILTECPIAANLPLYWVWQHSPARQKNGYASPLIARFWSIKIHKNDVLRTFLSSFGSDSKILGHVSFVINLYFLSDINTKLIGLRCGTRILFKYCNLEYIYICYKHTNAYSFKCRHIWINGCSVGFVTFELWGNDYRILIIMKWKFQMTIA